MKKVVLTLIAAAGATALISCKNEVPVNDGITSSSEPEIEVTSQDLALAADLPGVNSEDTYLYVTAFSGLTLREFNNLQSKKLARMPYGSKVKVLEAEADETMKIAGIKGGMDKVAFNHKNGFAFNGYLSRYFPPELNITVKGYASELKSIYQDVGYTEAVGGTASNPSNTQAIILPGAEWHEAYFIAQRLFDFPKEFQFPNAEGKEFETIVDGKPKRDMWTSQLEVTRSNGLHEKIEYIYSSKKFRSRVSIEKEGDAMKITKTEVLK